MDILFTPEEPMPRPKKIKEYKKDSYIISVYESRYAEGSIESKGFL